MLKGKRARITAIVIIIILLCAGASMIYLSAKQQPDMNQSIATDTKSEIELVFGRLDPIRGLSGMDIRGKNLSKLSIDELAGLSFDTNTIWPDKSVLPGSFSPEDWLNASKDPGLGLSDLHSGGITGKGVSIAVFDKPINSSHMEFSDRLFYKTTDIPGDFETLHFHGISCASIIGGNTCGVAPEVKIYYFAVPDNGRNFTNYCTAMDELIALNKTLPANDKIRLVSISDGLYEDGIQWDKWSVALEKAKAEGIEVNYSNSLGNKKFAWGGCPPYKDKNNPDNYVNNKNFAKGLSLSFALIPADYRTTAENEGNNAYSYWGESGFSWAIAYTTGLSALAYQVNPDITYDEILKLLYETKTINENGIGVINPESFIEAVGKVKTGS